MGSFLGYGKQWITDDDIAAVTEVLKSDFLTQGTKVNEFEDEICAYTGAKYCVVVANGTAALHLAIAALDIEKGKEGITSPNTFVASSNAMIYNGLWSVFADVNPKTYCIEPVEIEARITANTRLLVPVHFAGQACEMERIQQIAKKNNLFVIEDAAHAIGSMYEDGTKVGNCKYSDMTIFSFHPVKSMTTGEGGAITTNNEALYKKLLLLRSHGITKAPSEMKFDELVENNGPWYHEMQMLGFNFRLTDFQAALGISQLNKLDSFIKRRREIVEQYNGAFKGHVWLSVPYERPLLVSAFHLYVLKIDFDRIGKSRKQVIQELRNKNIGSQVHYIPVHCQPYYKSTFGFKIGDYPIAERFYKNALSIPLFPKMTNEEITHVIDCILNLA